MNDKRIKACLFDLDGTLLYTLTSIAKAGNAVLEAFGHPIEAEENYRFYCGDGADELVRRILAKAEDEDPSHFAEGCRINREVLKANALLGVRPYEGLPETLRILKERGLLLGVCSNKPDNAVREIIPGIFGGDLFDAVCGQREDLALKPKPDIPLTVLKSFKADPAECLYFGDSATDMKTGKGAGMTTVGVLWGYRTEKELLDGGADRVIRYPEEILELPELTRQEEGQNGLLF